MSPVSFSLKAWSGRHFSNKWVSDSRKNTDSKGINLILKATQYNRIWVYSYYEIQFTTRYFYYHRVLLNVHWLG